MTALSPKAHYDFDSVLQENHWTLVLCLFGICTAAKVLMFPAYRSTDFDVHLHWKALTLNLNHTSDWYFDDSFVSTVHTLDYPPSFAFMEYMWSNNYLTTWLRNHHWLDESCLALKESSSTRHTDHSVSCVAFMRTTVLISELVFWLAAYVWARLAASSSSHTPGASEASVSSSSSGDSPVSARGIHKNKFSWGLFLLLSLNPAILWLDHVHFQYNGFLLGILLLSVACLWRGLEAQQNTRSFMCWHLAAAILYAALLTFKHLYLMLAPWYFAYLLRKFCFIKNDEKVRFSVQRFLLLGSVTVATLVLPFYPFLSAPQLYQISQRLFPFGRGLVHDYWAGNIWALYMAFQKVVPKLPTDISPFRVAMILLASLLPGCWGAWKAGSTKNLKDAQLKMLQSFFYSALASFITAYHVHEKAIVTTLLPMTIWAMITTTTATTTTQQTDRHRGLLLFRTQAFALTGLLPLLFPATELLLKLTTLGAYLLLMFHFLEPAAAADSCFDWKRGNFLDACMTARQQVFAVVLVLIVLVFVLEVLPISLFGRFEFVPLALTSVVVASGLVLSYVEILFSVIFE